MHRSAGLIQDWPGAHSTWISMSRSSCLKAVMFPNFTVSIVFLWSVPPSVYFRRTLGTQSPWNLFLVAAGSLIGELQSFNMTNIFPVEWPINGFRYIQFEINQCGQGAFAHVIVKSSQNGSNWCYGLFSTYI